MPHWSTEKIRGRERFSFWRDAVCQAAFNVSIEPVDASHERFSASISANNAGALRLATSQSRGAYHLIRGRRQIESAPADHYSIFLQVRGQTIVHNGDDSVPIRPDDMAISDGRFAFSATITDHRQQVIAVMPQAMVEERAPWLRDSMWRKLSRHAPYADLARRHLHAMVTRGLSDHPAAGLLSENLCNLLALATAPEVAPGRLQPELQLEAMLAFCRQNLREPTLTPALVASKFGISLRTVHLRFAKLGKSFGRFVLETRLDVCARALRDPAQWTRSISDIAYGHGFNDLSHFNKSFRARFSMSPGEWRAEGAAPMRQ